MMKPAAEAVAAAKNAVANETIAVAKGSCNLVPLCHSLLPSPLLSVTLLSTLKKSPSRSPLLSRAREKEAEKIWFGFGMCGLQDKNDVGERFSRKRVQVL
jgi:hypothetical protein